jgi:hypothetical protein
MAILVIHMLPLSRTRDILYLLWSSSLGAGRGSKIFLRKILDCYEILDVASEIS